MGCDDWSSGPEDVIASLRVSARSWKDKAERLEAELETLRKIQLERIDCVGHANRRAEKAEAENARMGELCAEAARELEDYWDAHCDDDGCGPINLLYGLKAMTHRHAGLADAFRQMAEYAERLKAENARLREALTCIRWLARNGCHLEQTIERVVRLRNDIVQAVDSARAALKEGGGDLP